LIGYWSFNSYFDEIRRELLSNYRVKEVFFNEPYLRVRERIQKTEAVAIHIRRGDYVSNKQFNELFGVLPLEYYLAGVERIKRKVDHPRFFVFSDDPAWVKNFFSFEEEYFLVSEQEHLEDYHEFDLMRYCKHHIISNSTFSWWAAYLNDYEGRVIIQPRKWYQSKLAQDAYETNEFLFIKGAIRI
jgi:hypothetical protein